MIVYCEKDEDKLTLWQSLNWILYDSLTLGKLLVNIRNASSSSFNYHFSLTNMKTHLNMVDVTRTEAESSQQHIGCQCASISAVLRMLHIDHFSSSNSFEQTLSILVLILRGLIKLQSSRMIDWTKRLTFRWVTTRSTVLRFIRTWVNIPSFIKTRNINTGMKNHSFQPPHFAFAIFSCKEEARMLIGEHHWPAISCPLHSILHILHEKVSHCFD